MSETPDIAGMSYDELSSYYDKLKKERDDCDKSQYSLKIFMNSIYGAFGNQHFLCYNYDAAASITTQGQSLIKFGAKILEDYIQNKWVDDTELHDKLGVINPKQPSAVVIYGDTDSCANDTSINCADGINWNVEEMFNIYAKMYGVTFCENKYSQNQNEIIDNENDGMISIINYKNGNIEKTKIKRLMRHKVTKDKWVLKTKSGKSITVTGDHSMVVFRDGVQKVVKPCEILMSDKILCIQ